MLNVSSLARDLGIPQPTVRRYVEWLKITYQCYELPPYAANIGKRLVRTPKIHWSDSAMAAGLLGMSLNRYFPSSAGYPTVWASTILRCSGRFSALDRAARFTPPRTTVASPSEAQNR